MAAEAGDSLRPRGPYRFNDFVVDATAGELRKSGQAIPIRDQPFQVLVYLLERPAQLVRREDLYEHLWGQTVHVDFERNLNVAMARVRDALGDSPRRPRYIETVPRKGYRFICPLQPETMDRVPPAPLPRRRWIWIGAGIPVLLVLAWAAYAVISGNIRRAATEHPGTVARTPRQLTTDPGLSAWPDLDREGELVVFASDRDGGPDLDLWLHHISRGENTQLTNEPGDEFQPRFSPDGSRVAFTSTAAPGAFLVATTGGRPSLIEQEAWNPRFSPDGKTLAFSRNDPNRGYATQLFLADADGQRRRQIGDHMRFLGAGSIWITNDLLLAGGQTNLAEPRDWFVVDRRTDSVTPAGAAAFMPSDLDFSRPPPLGPLAWLDPEHAVLFSARQGASIDLWMIPFSVESKRATGDAIRFTGGTDLNFEVGTAPSGAVVYSGVSQNVDLWRLPLDRATGLAAGEPTRLTTGVGADSRPFLSADGRVLGFQSTASARNLRRSQIKISALPEFAPAPLKLKEHDLGAMYLSPNGEDLLYEYETNADSGIMTLSTKTGAPRRVCSGCGRLVGWSPDRRYIVHLGDSRDAELIAFDAQTGKHHVLTTHARYLLGDVSFAPNQKWITFTAITRGMAARQLVVMPFDPSGEPLDESAWTPLTSKDRYSLGARWSSGGDRVYYFSAADGPLGIWVQRMTQDTGKPIGEPALVYVGGHGMPRLFVDALTGMGFPRLAAGDDFLIFDTVEVRGNIWLLEPKAGSD